MMSILYWLAWAFLPILIVALAVWWLSRKVTKRLGWRLFAVAMVPVVAFWDVIPTQIAFNRLCEKEGGLKIYRTVEDVHGIAVLPLINDCIEFCVDYLVEKGYDFVEGGIGRSLDYKKWEKFRYWLAPATDPACQRRLPSPLITKWDFEKEAALNARLGGNCIARKSIPAITSDYIYFSFARFDPNVAGPLAVTKLSHRVVDRGTGEVLAEINSFHLHKGWYVRRFIDWTANNSPRLCPAPDRLPLFEGPPSERYGRIRDVLVPAAAVAR